MQKYMNELIENGMGTVIDMSVDKVIMQDETYIKDLKDGNEVKECLVDTFTNGQKQMFEDYVACIMSAQERACHIAYLTGAKHVIEFIRER